MYSAGLRDSYIVLYELQGQRGDTGSSGTKGDKGSKVGECTVLTYNPHDDCAPFARATEVLEVMTVPADSMAYK